MQQPHFRNPIVLVFFAGGLAVVLALSCLVPPDLKSDVTCTILLCLGGCGYRLCLRLATRFKGL